MKYIKTLLAILLSTLLLMACGGGDSSSGETTTTNNDATITGTAATGAAIAGKTVTAVDTKGRKTTAVTADDGRYTITIDKTANPYMLKIDNGMTTLFSVALTPGARANITPMTTLAIQEMNKTGSGDYEPLMTLFDSFDSKNGIIKQQGLDEAVAKVKANLGLLFDAEGVDKGFDFLTEAFSANGTGIDAILDAIDISFDATNPGAMTISIIGGSTFAFDPSIDYLGFINSNVTSPGNWKLIVQRAVAGVPLPFFLIDNIPSGVVPTEESVRSTALVFEDRFGSNGGQYTVLTANSTKLVIQIKTSIPAPTSSVASPLPVGYDMSPLPAGYDMSPLPAGYDMSPLPAGYDMIFVYLKL